MLQATPTGPVGVQLQGAQTVSQLQQLLAEDRGVWWPVGRLFGHRLGYQPPYHQRNLIGQRGRRLQQVPEGGRDRMLAGEGAAAGQTLIGDHPQGVQVAGWPLACSGER